MMSTTGRTTIAAGSIHFDVLTCGDEGVTCCMHIVLIISTTKVHGCWEWKGERWGGLGGVSARCVYFPRWGRGATGSERTVHNTRLRDALGPEPPHRQKLPPIAARSWHQHALHNLQLSQTAWLRCLTWTALKLTDLAARHSVRAAHCIGNIFSGAVFPALLRGKGALFSFLVTQLSVLLASSLRLGKP